MVYVKQNTTKTEDIKHESLLNNQKKNIQNHLLQMVKIIK